MKLALFILLASVAVAQTIDPPLPTQPPASATKREKDTYAFAMYWYAEGVKQRAAAIAASKLSAEDRAKLDSILFFVTPKVNATVSWTVDAESRSSGFQVERSSNGADFSVIGFPMSADRSYVDRGLSVGSAYWYRVRTLSLVVAPSDPSNVMKYVAVAP